MNWRESRLLTALLAILSAALMVLAFPDPDVELLAWVGLCPLLFRLPDLPPRAAFRWGYLWGVVFQTGLLSWLFPVKVPETTLAATVLVLVYALLPAACFWGFRRVLLARPAAAWLLMPFFWVSAEWLSAALPVFSFPWCLLGYSQYRNLPVVQLASITGVFGVSFLVLSANACLAFWLRRVIAGEEEPARWVLGATLGLLFLMLCVWAWGRARLRAQRGGETVEVALLQGNYDHLRKWHPNSLEDILDTYEGLSREAGRARPDLVVWPETALPAAILDYPELEERVRRIVRQSGSFSLVGALKSPPGLQPELDAEVHYNTVFLYGPDGNRLPQEYYKRHLVPFGEYVPFQKLLFFIDIVSAGAGLFLPGDRATLFEMPRRDGRGPLRFGVLICYESAFPSMAREYAGAGADLLIVVTNDAWYGKTAMPYQHAAMALFRAAETGLPLVRSANTGLTLWADACGRVQETLERPGGSLYVTGLLAARPRLGRLTTFYSRWGDIFSYGCLAATLAAMGMPWLRRKAPRIQHDRG